MLKVSLATNLSLHLLRLHQSHKHRNLQPSNLRRLKLPILQWLNLIQHLFRKLNRKITAMSQRTMPGSGASLHR